MSEVHIGASIQGAILCESGNAAAGAVHFLSLAAAPTFALMAFLAGALDIAPQDLLCASAQHASPLNGMVVMNLLMSAFHSAPWLKLISRRQNGARRADPTGDPDFPRTLIGMNNFGLHPNQR
jgi:hypothetical protein